ncbi:hypothetical protein K474DRAFT_1598176 [Panus rudis PR-1116 ss-1]|nr:hypothetical protein K474DRAFT_1598176 [Panus rudis PR-1116 ss-1]
MYIELPRYCEECDVNIVTYKQYKNHRCRYMCRDCDREFSSRVGLIQHYVQSPRHPYCQECNEHFDTEDDLVMHCKEHHYYCDKCPKNFHFARGLYEHLRQKHDYTSIDAHVEVSKCTQMREILAQRNTPKSALIFMANCMTCSFNLPSLCILKAWPLES